MAQLICKNLSLGYDGREIINSINFSVNKGDYLCIIGENGSGKTTLMKAILGLIQPISGEMIFADGFSKKEIGYLPQQTDYQRDFPATVYEIVVSGFQSKLGFKPFYSKEEKTLAEKNMELMGILHLKKRCYRELSGGQQQRVLLARALCAAKNVLLLDEPVTGLDPKVSQEMYSLIETLNKSGITIIMISHDIASAIKYGSHILRIDRGNKDLFFGTVSEYAEKFSKEQL